MLVPVVLNSGGAKHIGSIVPTHCAKAEQLLTLLSGLLSPGSLFFAEVRNVSFFLPLHLKLFCVTFWITVWIDGCNKWLLGASVP